MFLTTLEKWFQFLKPATQRPARPGCRLSLEELEGRWVPAVTAPVTSGSAASLFNAVAQAKNGATILVPPGTYNLTQPLVITQNNLKLTASDQDGDGDDANHLVTINAPAGISSTGAIIDIQGGQNVKIQGFIIDGDGLVMDAAVRVIDGGSATISDNVIENTFQNSPTTNNQRGYGIRVGDNGDVLGELTPGTATIDNNIIQTYNKGGVIVDGQGSQASITNNFIIGQGLIAVVDQNGVQISNGATGDISGNYLIGNEYQTTGPITALGVEIFQTTGDVTVADNVLKRNGSGIEINRSANAQVFANYVTQSIYDGIILTDSSYTDIAGNIVAQSGGDGISLSGSSNNQIAGNQATGSVQFGGLYLENSNSNDIDGNNFHNNHLDGIQAVSSNNNNIHRNEIKDNGQDGVLLQSSNGNVIADNEILGNHSAGVVLEGSTGNVVKNNYLAPKGDK